MNAVTLASPLSPAASGSTALSLRSPWALVPSLGNVDAYITAVNRLPMLTPAEEADYARRLREHSDLEAAGRLVLSHLRLVVSVSRQYLGYGLPQGDLIQEGNVGLMKPVKRFDPAQGVRLVSYALHWIKAEIHEYILRNWRMVKVATTKAQRQAPPAGGRQDGRTAWQQGRRVAHRSGRGHAVHWRTVARSISFSIRSSYRQG